MLGYIFELLQEDKYYGVSENIDIAKGKYKAPENLKELKQTIKRNKWQLQQKTRG